MCSQEPDSLPFSKRVVGEAVSPLVASKLPLATPAKFTGINTYLFKLDHEMRGFSNCD